MSDCTFDCLLHVRKPLALALATVIGRSPYTMRQVLRARANWYVGGVARRRIAVQSRIIQHDNRYTLWSTPYGQVWVSRAQRPENLLAEQEVQQVYGSGERGVRVGDTVLDCGANVGIFARAALRRGAALIVCAEPAPENLECLRRNLAEEIASGSVVVVPKAIWESAGTLTFAINANNPAANKAAALTDSPSETVEVETTTVDLIVSELKLPRIDFIKFDIEGAEPEGLRGAAATLQRYQPRLALTTEHRAEDAVALPKLLHSINDRYTVECGLCVFRDGRVRPDILLCH